MVNTADFHETDMMILVAMLWFLYCLVVLLIFWTVRFGMGALRRTDCATLAARYGAVFQVPTGTFTHNIVLCDPAAIAHFYANAPGIYRTPEHLRRTTKTLVGRGLAWAEGERHRSHRQALAPLFTQASIEQNFVPVFFEMAQKMHSSWRQDLRTRPRGMIVDIKHWMNCVVLDSLGVAGFAHDFDSLKGDYCIVTAAFHALRAPKTSSSLSNTIFRLASSYAPSLLFSLPTAKNRVIQDFRGLMSRLAGDVLERSTIKDGLPDTSFLGLLIKSLAENPAGEFRLSHEEVLAQNTLLFSALGTTAASLCWTLVELARNPICQDTLRTELRQAGALSTYCKISKLPYLHAVVYETLRLHPPVEDTTRVASADDVIPLSAPISSKLGETVSSIRIAKSCTLTVPIQYVNTSEAFWGPGALKFDPGRWWQWQDKSNADFPGNRHLAFGDGARGCIGADFAFALIKVVLAVTVAGFEISLPGGPETVIAPVQGCVPFPGISSEMLVVVRKL